MLEKRSGPLLLFLLLACCKAPNDAADDVLFAQLPPHAAPNEALTTIDNALGSLLGEWRVAGIDGRSVDGDQGLALTGDGETLWWQPRCAGMARGYRIAGNSISFHSLEPPRPAGSPTPPVCAIGLPHRLNDVFRALDAATTITRTAQNGILIAGRDHSVTLFSQ